MEHTICRAMAALGSLTLILALAACAGTRQSHRDQSLSLPRQHETDRMLKNVSAERIRHDVDALSAFGTRHTLSETQSETRGIGAARRWVLREFQKTAADRCAAGLPPMEAMLDPHTLQPDGRRIDRVHELANVVAIIPGRLESSGTAERIYFGGHLDSRNSNEMDFTKDAPGANDDASGVAMLIEACRVMAQHEFDHTLVFVAFDAEEAGLYGARKHVEQALASGTRIRAMLNNDTVGDPSSPDGRWTRDEIRIYSEGLPATPPGNTDMVGARAGTGPALVERLRREAALGDSGSRQLARYIDEVANAHRTRVQPTLVFRADRFLRGGDHTPFHEAGVAAVRFTEVDEEYNRQHQDVRTENGIEYGDLPEFVDAEYVAGVTQLNIAVASHLAQAPTAPVNARLVAAQLMNDSIIRWNASPDPDVAGYEVVWRETTSPVWQHVVDAGLATEITLPVGKDAVFFGVRAYDRDGYRSLVSFAYAARE